MTSLMVTEFELDVGLGLSGAYEISRREQTRKRRRCGEEREIYRAGGLLRKLVLLNVFVFLGGARDQSQTSGPKAPTFAFSFPPFAALAPPELRLSSTLSVCVSLHRRV